MTELDVRADGLHRYAATITTDEGTSHEHAVTCDEDLLAELGLGKTEEPLLVRRALEVLARSADPAGLPGVIDLRELHRQRPDLLPSLTLRTAI